VFTKGFGKVGRKSVRKMGRNALNKVGRNKEAKKKECGKQSGKYGQRMALEIRKCKAEERKS
jgi:hypothetical protein